MKKILPAMLAFLFIFSAADAQKARNKNAKYRKHNSKPTYYYQPDGTLSDKPPGKAVQARRASAYKGDNVPENDGQKKNEHRNINYNSGQPLPSSSGK